MNTNQISKPRFSDIQSSKSFRFTWAITSALAVLFYCLSIRGIGLDIAVSAGIAFFCGMLVYAFAQILLITFVVLLPPGLFVAGMVGYLLR